MRDLKDPHGKVIDESWIPKEKKDDEDTSMVTTDEKEEGEEPLHDMTCVGIDTCSARSISCMKEDFLDLEMMDNKKKDDQLRGVGGNSGVAGKGCLGVLCFT
jgi:hypothetical protein